VCQLDVESQCNVNSDCPVGQICGVDAQCRDACTTSRDCVKGQVCVSGTCADPEELTNGGLVTEGTDSGVPAAGLPCSFNSDCPSPLLCRGAICASECRTTSDCSPGLACDNSRCVVPLACSLGDAGADPRAGGPCLYSSQCPVPLACVHGYCSCECLGAQDCAPGFACVSNRCQAVLGGANSVEIGSQGGTVTSSDGKLSMNVPAGAIDGSIVFAVKAATAWPSGAVGTVYEVEPSGTRFSKPATIALSYAGIDLGARAAADLFVGTAVGSSWESLGTAVNDTHAQTVASTTAHLSVFGLVFFDAARSDDAGVVISKGGSPGIAGSGSTGTPGGAGRSDFGGQTDFGGSSSVGGTAPVGGTGNAGFISSGGRAGGAGSGGRAGGPGSGGAGAGGLDAGLGGAVTAGKAGALGSGGTGAGGFSSGGAGGASMCSGGCACLSAAECPPTAPFVCCYITAKDSSSCTSPTACTGANGTPLP
jgi:hypothetical protein